MDINKELEAARELVEQTGVNLFVTGRAGTGKTTFLKSLQQSPKKKMIVLAPTGIAAINAGGMTIHSFFQLSFAPFIPGIGQTDHKSLHRFTRDKLRVIKSLDLLVIDEISMVRADLLDAIDDVLRRIRNSQRPFGGVQLLMFGDLGQLAPVALESEWKLLSQHYRSNYFFDSHALSSTGFETIELKKVYRQQEGEFLDILNAIRENNADSVMLEKLNSRVVEANKIKLNNIIRLVTHNHQADSINNRMLEELPGKIHSFKSIISGDFSEYNIPTDKELNVKLNTQVMFIKNDSSGLRRYYNGMLGTVTGFIDDSIIVTPMDGSPDILVNTETWDNNKYIVDEETNELKEIKIGEFTQYPLRKAWAITIHKSQGLTFDRAIIDSSMAFAHGQTYVALSRCRTLDGLFLERPIRRESIINDRVVVNFLQSRSFEALDSETIRNLKNKFAISLLDSLFDFKNISFSLEQLTRLMKAHFQITYPVATRECEELHKVIVYSLQSVCDTFGREYHRIIIHEQPDDKGHRLTLDNRLAKAASYFLEQFEKYKATISIFPSFHDNKVVDKKLNNIITNLKDAFHIKSHIFKNFMLNGFSTIQFLHIKAEAELSLLKPSPGKQSRKNRDFSSHDIIYPELYATLLELRKSKAIELNKPTSSVATLKTIVNIVNLLPLTRSEIKQVPGVGKAFMANFADAALKVINDFCNQNQI